MRDSNENKTNLDIPKAEMRNVLKILTINNPEEEKILRTTSRDVNQEEIKSDEFSKFLDQLLQTALTSEEQVGVQSAGISAPQVGKNLRVFYILNNETKKFDLFINPHIIYSSPSEGLEQDIQQEGCLSVPGREEDVARYKRIEIQYLNAKGEKEKRVLKDLDAREAQHENDHLDGILFIDRIEN